MGKIEATVTRVLVEVEMTDTYEVGLSVPGESTVLSPDEAITVGHDLIEQAWKAVLLERQDRINRGPRFGFDEEALP